MAVSGYKNVVWKPGSIVSFKTSAAVAEGDVVEITGDMTVAPAAADSVKVVGVAMQTASAANDVIAVQLLGFVFRLKAAGAIAAGDQLQAAGAGAVRTRPAFTATIGAAYAEVATEDALLDAASILGVALEAIANGQTGRVVVGGSY